MSPSKWRHMSAVVILRELAAGRDAGETMTQIRKRIDAAYPFGTREYWPYKQWLAVRRDLFFQHGIRTDAQQAAEDRALNSLPLFNDSTQPLHHK